MLVRRFAEGSALPIWADCCDAMAMEPEDLLAPFLAMHEIDISTTAYLQSQNGVGVL